MQTLSYPGPQGTQASVELVALRVVMGVAFILHGWPKIQNAFGWMGADSGVPGILQAAAAVAEFGGEITLALGLLTRLTALSMAGVMVGALALVHLLQGYPFVMCAALFVLLGPGRFSLVCCYLVELEARVKVHGGWIVIRNSQDAWSLEKAWHRGLATSPRNPHERIFRVGTLKIGRLMCFYVKSTNRM